MDVSSWRVRVLLEPRGFIRVIEFVLSIVAFATTGGFSGVSQYSVLCTNTFAHIVEVTISYPFRLYAHDIMVPNCTNTTLVPTRMDGDLSPSSQWFVCVGVLAFLYTLAAIIFYVVFDAAVRQTHDRIVTIGDLVATVIFAFLWLTAASAWAWGLGQVKMWSSSARFFQNAPLAAVCGSATCTPGASANFSPLNASVAFGFLNFFLWCCNVWFVYKESPYHQEPPGDQGTGNYPEGQQSPNNM
ncbi:synaptophysin [Ciona intestinalis]